VQQQKIKPRKRPKRSLSLLHRPRPQVIAISCRIPAILRTGTGLYAGFSIFDCLLEPLDCKPSEERRSNKRVTMLAVTQQSRKNQL
jgi:hypothetical protein